MSSHLLISLARVSAVSVFIAVTLAARSVVAQPGLTPVTEPEMGTVLPGNAGPGEDDTADRSGVAVHDPRADQAFLVPTAITQPKGSFTVHDREVLFPGFTYGLSDKVQVGLFTMVAPVLFLGSEVKMRIYDRGNVHIALTSHLGMASEIDGGGDDRVVMGLFGVTGTRCADARCGSSITGVLMGGGAVAFDEFNSDSITALYAAIALTTRLTDRMKFLFEVQGFMVFEEYSDDDDKLITFMGGVRYHKRHMAVDFGLMGAATKEWDWMTDSYSWQLVDGVLPNLVVPWLNLAYRWD